MAATSAQRQLIATGPQPHAPGDRERGATTRFNSRAIALRRKAATVLLVAASMSLAAYAVFGHDGLVAYQQKQRQSRELQQKIKMLQQENEALALHDQRLRSDPDTIEFEAREQMHYTRPGEVIYTLPQAPGATHK